MARHQLHDYTIISIPDSRIAAPFFLLRLEIQRVSLEQSNFLRGTRIHTTSLLTFVMGIAAVQGAVHTVGLVTVN